MMPILMIPVDQIWWLSPVLVAGLAAFEIGALFRGRRQRAPRATTPLIPA